MTEPTTANIGLIVPNTGDLVGAWGTAALNPNWQIVDGMTGGVLNLSLSAATTITLTTTTASFTPSAGPNQSSNALIALSGTLTGNGVLKFSVPGFYAVLNNCTVGSNYVQLSPASGTGRSIGCPDGEFIRAFFDGTHMYWVGAPHVGAFIDLCVATTPAWMNAFSIAPYLLCNGATYSTSTFPALSAKVGSTFGGNGVSTFGVPDAQNRYFIPIDFGGNNRITPIPAGIDGTVFGAVGGDQHMLAHSHANSLTDPGHQHSQDPQTVLRTGGPTSSNVGGSGSGSQGTTGTASTGITITNATTGSGTAGNIPPGFVGGMKFIKT